jgi:amino acid adenylation domain-containing protein
MRVNILEYFESAVKRFPERTAIIEEDHSISFTELEGKAILLAREITNKVQTRNRPIAVLLPKGINCIVADIAVLLSGNPYMNVDVKSPFQRLQNILRQIDPVLIITENRYMSAFPFLTDQNKVLDIADVRKMTSETGDSINYSYKSLIDTDPLCIINTSGSTGTPKGVVLNHRSFIDFTECAIETLGIRNRDIIGSLSPAVFDIYSFELCMMMAMGSTIVVLPEQLAAFPARILNILIEKKVTFIFWVPSIMVNISNLGLLSKLPLPDLQTVWFAGEVFPTKQFNYWKKFLPGVKFVNLYGPIEITLDCTYFIVDRDLTDDEPIPIGFPFRNTDVIVLNSDNKLAATNEEGELCVRGTSLAMGYYNDPAKTAEVFVQNPLHNNYPELIYRTGDIVTANERGELIFKGRKDSLIKHMGYRIELAEIEHVIINTLKIVENCIVDYNFKKKEIILFYESKADIPIPELKLAMTKIFPKYMIPSSFHRMLELPRNNNGKIDRLLLKQIANSGKD